MTSRQLGMTLSIGMTGALLAGVAVAAESKVGDPVSVLSKLHESNQMEIAAGRLAQDRGRSKDVKSFGKTLVTDHSASDKKVMQLARDEKIDLGESMPSGKMDKLQSASDADFDRMFAAEMLEDHKKAVAQVKEAREATSDAKLKALLAKTIPMLEKHRDTAQKLLDRLGPSANASDANVIPTSTMAK